MPYAISALGRDPAEGGLQASLRGTLVRLFARCGRGALLCAHRRAQRVRVGAGAWRNGGPSRSCVYGSCKRPRLRVAAVRAALLAWAALGHQAADDFAVPAAAARGAAGAQVSASHDDTCAAAAMAAPVSVPSAVVGRAAQHLQSAEATAGEVGGRATVHRWYPNVTVAVMPSAKNQ